MGTYPGTFRPSLNSTKLCPSETGRERPRTLRYVVGPALFKEAIILSMTPQKTGQYMQGIIQGIEKVFAEGNGSLNRGNLFPKGRSRRP